MKWQILKVLCPIHELVTHVFSLPTVHRSLPALPAFSALFCLPAFSHVDLEVEHFTVLAKVTGWNSVQMLIIPRSLYFLNFLSAISSRVLESLFRGSNIVLQIFLNRISFFLATPLLLPQLKISM